jgi:glycerophosphoryl diester phosphodiesterase
MASGADSHGAHWAHDNGIEVKEFHAQWKRFGRSAGPRRNQHMADNADALIAVWDGQSHGTKNMIDIARSRGLMVHVWHIESKLTYSTPSQAELFK